MSVRQTRGLDASAACGQLRNEFQKVPLLDDAKVEESLLEVAKDEESQLEAAVA